MHDFADPELGKAIPYGIYDITSNDGWVSVGTDHDTSAFAVRPCAAGGTPSEAPATQARTGC